MANTRSIAARYRPFGLESSDYRPRDRGWGATWTSMSRSKSSLAAGRPLARAVEPVQRSSGSQVSYSRRQCCGRLRSVAPAGPVTIPGSGGVSRKRLAATADAPPSSGCCHGTSCLPLPPRGTRRRSLWPVLRQPYMLTARSRRQFRDVLPGDPHLRPRRCRRLQDPAGRGRGGACRRHGPDWAGCPLRSYETIVKYISTTRTETGRRVTWPCGRVV